MTTIINDEKKRNAAPKSSKPAKPAKLTKAQRTLFDMFSKKPSVAASETIVQSMEDAAVPNEIDNLEVNAGQAAITDSETITDSSISTFNERNQTYISTSLVQKGLEKDPSNCTTPEPDGDVLILLHQTNLQGSKDVPIVIDSSPIKLTVEDIDESPVSQPKKSIHPFFASRTKSTNSTRFNRQLREKNPEIPYPDRESQHAKGPQSSYTSAPCPFARRTVSPLPDALHLQGNNTPLLNFLIPHEQTEGARYFSDPPAANPRDYVSTINQTHQRDHPAIARVVEATMAGFPSQSSHLWTETWQPRSAKEVLGNEDSAIILRNWLHTLAIQLDPIPSNDESAKTRRKKPTRKRQRVVREVARKKPRKDGLDNFIVDDDEEEDVYDYSILPEYLGLDDQMSEVSSQTSAELGDETSSLLSSDAPEFIAGQLRNTILLSGPSGSGKTAAVYACAKELGWEVFEVYPGIGRRNGTNVDNLVGDVGKNHLVRKTQAASKRQTIATLLSRGAGSLEVDFEGEHSTHAINSVHEDESLNKVHDVEHSFRQSLILLEEVDVLFKDDVNFWATVTNLIKDCRRPVICTCNDISLIPVDALPLQRILYFESCDPAVAVSYLQGLACAEGHLPPSEWLTELYSDTFELTGADVPNDTSSTKAHSELPTFDLRKAINNLQLTCTTGDRWASKNRCDRGTYQDILDDSVEWTGDSPVDEFLGWPAEVLKSEEKVATECDIDGLSKLISKVDLLSYLNGCMALPSSRRREALTFGQLQPSPDDESGHTIVYSSSANDEFAMHGFHDRDIDMASTTIRLARGCVARGRILVDGARVHLRWPLFRRRLEYEQELRKVLRSVKLSNTMDEVVYTEYVPYLRQMVWQEIVEPEGRTTRNSLRARGSHGILQMEKRLQKVLRRMVLVD